MKKPGIHSVLTLILALVQVATGIPTPAVGSRLSVAPGVPSVYDRQALAPASETGTMPPLDRFAFRLSQWVKRYVPEFWLSRTLRHSELSAWWKKNPAWLDDDSREIWRRWNQPVRIPNFWHPHVRFDFVPAVGRVHAKAHDRSRFHQTLRDIDERPHTPKPAPLPAWQEALEVFEKAVQWGSDHRSRATQVLIPDAHYSLEWDERHMPPMRVSLQSMWFLDFYLIAQWGFQGIPYWLFWAGAVIGRQEGFQIVSHDWRGRRRLEGFATYMDVPGFGLYVSGLVTAPWRRADRSLKGFGSLLMSRLMEESMRYGYGGRLFALPGSPDGYEWFESHAFPTFQGSTKEGRRSFPYFLVPPALANTFVNSQSNRTGLIPVDVVPDLQKHTTPRVSIADVYRSVRARYGRYGHWDSLSQPATRLLVNAKTHDIEIIGPVGSSFDGGIASIAMKDALEAAGYEDVQLTFSTSKTVNEMVVLVGGHRICFCPTRQAFDDPAMQIYPPFDYAEENRMRRSVSAPEVIGGINHKHAISIDVLDDGRSPRWYVFAGMSMDSAGLTVFSSVLDLHSPGHGLELRRRVLIGWKDFWRLKDHFPSMNDSEFQSIAGRFITNGNGTPLPDPVKHRFAEILWTLLKKVEISPDQVDGIYPSFVEYEIPIPDSPQKVTVYLPLALARVASQLFIGSRLTISGSQVLQMVRPESHGQLNDGDIDVVIDSDHVENEAVQTRLTEAFPGHRIQRHIDYKGLDHPFSLNRLAMTFEGLGSGKFRLSWEAGFTQQAYQDARDGFLRIEKPDEPLLSTAVRALIYQRRFGFQLVNVTEEWIANALSHDNKLITSDYRAILKLWHYIHEPANIFLLLIQALDGRLLNQRAAINMIRRLANRGELENTLALLSAAQRLQVESWIDRNDIESLLAADNDRRPYQTRLRATGA